MNELTTEHYRALLGLDANWKLTSVEFLPKQKAVDIHVIFCGSGLKCPKRKCNCTQADLAPQRSWRHLDTMKDTLMGTRQLWLYALENLPKDKSATFLSLQMEDLQTGRAWSIKENFRHFWECKTIEDAEVYFRSWYSWSTHSKLAPIAKVATMLKRHLEGILAYITHRITNATSEVFNSRIQSIKIAARGFRNFENYWIRILFFCGRLKLISNVSSH